MQELRVVHDLPYKVDDVLSEYERCTLDLYLPTAEKFPVVIWLHGGGLEGGDKSDADPAGFGRALARHGVGAVVANYRLTPRATYPAYLDDAAAVFAWTVRHIAQQGGDATNVFLAGHSAGGYLAAGVGFDDRYLASYGLQRSMIRGLIPVSPQVFTHFNIRRERGIANHVNTPVIDDAAPCYHVRPDAPPMLLMIGDNDFPARLEECRYFMAMLKVVGHTAATMEVIANREHGSIVERSKDDSDPVLVKTVEFVRKFRSENPRPVRRERAG